MIYYHVAAESYKEGDDLLSMEAMIDRGWEVEYKWSEYQPLEDYHDPDKVCLFTKLQDAEEFQEEFGGKILEIDLEKAIEPRDIRMRKSEEGWDAVVYKIPAECIKLVK